MTDERYTIAEAPLGWPFGFHQLRRDCRAVIGSVAWPGKRSGFALVLAVVGDRRLTAPEMHLLDEVEADDLNELVRQCHRMDGVYEPSRWVGDNRHQAALRIMRELSASIQPEGGGEPRRSFRQVCPSSLLTMDGLYAYLMPLLKRVLAQESRELWLKTSSVLGYLGEIKPDEIAVMKLGDYPPIEALGFGVREALDWVVRAQARPAPSWQDRVRQHPMAF